MAPVTLAQAKANLTNPVDLAVIDETRKFGGVLLERMPFDPAVSPVGGGGALTYGYTRLLTERGAGFRRVNTEYVTQTATRERKQVDLVPLGGTFEVDRVLARSGPAATGEVSFQLSQLIKSTVQKFADEFVNGTSGAPDSFDTATPGFDGIDKIVTGSITEKVGVSPWYGWGTAVANTSSRDQAESALDELTEWLMTMDGTPSVILGNYQGIARLQALARRATVLNRLEDAFGQEVVTFRGIPMMNLGEKPASSADIVRTSAPAAGVKGYGTLYAVRFGLDAVHGVTTPGPMVQTWLPQFQLPGAVKTGEIEMGPVAIACKRVRAVGAFRFPSAAAL